MGVLGWGYLRCVDGCTGVGVLEVCGWVYWGGVGVGVLGVGVGCADGCTGVGWGWGWGVRMGVLGWGYLRCVDGCTGVGGGT